MRPTPAPVTRAMSCEAGDACISSTERDTAVLQWTWAHRAWRQSWLSGTAVGNKTQNPRNLTRSSSSITAEGRSSIAWRQLGNFLSLQHPAF